MEIFGITAPTKLPEFVPKYFLKTIDHFEEKEIQFNVFFPKVNNFWRIVILKVNAHVEQQHMATSVILADDIMRTAKNSRTSDAVFAKQHPR
ncbi:methionyl-tRNA synthetase [Enterocytozoon bieneusi H348]|nr:methionyl-tRNA synthetase [Enterocytozoon bieneusi H348]|eukprot:XP_002650889.1 methionyl-tRNA synthetase [Enterocytozoon bieneusi H348]